MTDEWAPELVAEPTKDGVDRAVRAARRVVDGLVRAGRGSAADLEGVAGELERLADHLEDHAPDLGERIRQMWGVGGLEMTRHDPVTGPENALAPPLVVQGRSEKEVSGEVTFGLAYQGPPGHVHGGCTALVLDHALGMANHWAGTSGMTAKLALRYHRRTPLFVPLQVVARQVSVDGRRIVTTGEVLTPDGEVCVSAEGLFVVIDVSGAAAAMAETLAEN
ncbi:MAG: PaaI family thioesterase [Nocardioides sp.]|nr:PaaI family thioesterase [Nocardioides sp.]